MTTRARFHGAWQILLYNRHFYTWTLAGLIVALTLTPFMTPLFRTLLAAICAPAIWWLFASLAVSHYVYDRSPLYTFHWLGRCLTRAPRDWLNLHAGLDAGPALHALFPLATGRTLDIFDAAEMTERSIHEARRNAAAQIPAQVVDWRALPVSDGAIDAAFLLFTAHELRRAEARTQLFLEIRRVLRVGGEVVLVEHLRNHANFLAFGPGFMHFFSERAWRKTAQSAGLQLRLLDSLTPFVNVFVLARPS